MDFQTPDRPTHPTNKKPEPKQKGLKRRLGMDVPLMPSLDEEDEQSPPVIKRLPTPKSLTHRSLF